VVNYTLVRDQCDRSHRKHGCSISWTGLYRGKDAEPEVEIWWRPDFFDSVTSYLTSNTSECLSCTVKEFYSAKTKSRPKYTTTSSFATAMSIIHHMTGISLSLSLTRLTALCPGLPGWAGTRKAKPIWILLKQETVSGSGISWAICKSAPRSRQITTPAPHRSVFYRPDALPAAQPTVSKHWRYDRYLFNTNVLTSSEYHLLLSPLCWIKANKSW